MNPLLLVLLAYLLGAVPTSYWVGRGAYGVDLRRAGSGNLGATNTFRVLGWKAAVPVIVFDVLKGWVPVVLFPSFDAETGVAWALAYGGAAIVGHVFSIWVGFRGGKGVATSSGVFLGLAPWAVLLGLVVWLVTVLVTRIVSLGSILAAVALPIGVWLLPSGPFGGDTSLLLFTAGLSLFVLWAHRANLRRLVRGEELRFGAPPGTGPEAGPASESPAAETPRTEPSAETPRTDPSAETPRTGPTAETPRTGPAAETPRTGEDVP